MPIVGNSFGNTLGAELGVTVQKIKLDVFFENLDLGGEKFYFKIKNGNIKKFFRI